MRTQILLAGAAAALLSLAANAELDPKAVRAFKSKCASCHGAAGKGDTDMGKKLKIPDLSAAAFQKGTTDDGIKSMIKDGMKGDKKVEDHALGAKVGDQLDNLVKVVRSFAK